VPRQGKSKCENNIVDVTKDDIWGKATKEEAIMPWMKTIIN